MIPAEHPFGAMRPEQLSVEQFVLLTNDIAIHMADTKK